MFPLNPRNLLIAVCLVILGGCAYLPEVSRQPTFFNPFPQLTKIAVVPFFNLSAEPSADGRQFALAYAAELQMVPGFEIVPVGVTEAKMQEYRIVFNGKNGPAEARKLAQLLQVDAVVVGAITDYTPYYPPRVGIDVEWYAANPGFHPIPAGYGLPWGTQAEEEIPEELIFEAERALAREQLKTQTPYMPEPELAPPPPPAEAPAPRELEEEAKRSPSGVRLVELQAEVATGPEPLSPGNSAAPSAGDGATVLPPDWPDPRGFTPQRPCADRPPLRPSDQPVLKHVKLYHGTDAQVTAALQSYVYFRDEARFGGWQSYLQRSDDFVRFCCHLHIAEMLTARGGAGQTRVVWRWPTGR
ncbi:MAG: hypothetical protein JNK76_16960 [Planctomycetales bacterium]|nr:hypothetical protein [Planctomycetales bacterium]MBN8624083.1 hypothetical protein [Planctomycetota bacterium]